MAVNVSGWGTALCTLWTQIFGLSCKDAHMYPVPYVPYVPCGHRFLACPVRMLTAQDKDD